MLKFSGGKFQLDIEEAPSPHVRQGGYNAHLQETMVCFLLTPQQRPPVNLVLA